MADNRNNTADGSQTVSSDITATGAQNYKELQEQNRKGTETDRNISETQASELETGNVSKNTKEPDGEQDNTAMWQYLEAMSSYTYNPEDFIYEGTEQSPLMQQSDYKDYWGNSFFDDKTATDVEYQRLSDIRAENQPGLLKVTNGIFKGAVLAITTALETAGIAFGIGQGIYNEVTNDDYKDGDIIGNIGKAGESYLEGLWDNPFTRVLKGINDFSEEIMPNYYTQDEQDNPLALRNIFSANTLGDKLIKNFGFMIGAFFGGVPEAKLLGWAGKALVTAERASVAAKDAAIAAKVAKLTERAAGDTKKLSRFLKAAHLTEAEQKAVMHAGQARIQKMINATRESSKFIGAFSASLNEGAIEAINNSEDMANTAKAKAKADYENDIAAIEAEYGGTEMESDLKMQRANEYRERLRLIDEKKGEMGTADMLLNLPILFGSNMFQYGRLWSRGFKTNQRALNHVSWFRKPKAGILTSTEELKNLVTNKEAVIRSLLKANSEGLEEYLQRAASDGAGNAVLQSIDDYLNSGNSDDAKTSVGDYILGFGKAILENSTNESAWEEYLLGAVSAAIGMPVFGSQTRNAWLGKGKSVGLAGGLIGNFKEAKEGGQRYTDLVKHLREHVNKPEYKSLYQQLLKEYDITATMDDLLQGKDIKRYKDLDFKGLVADIMAASDAGLLGEYLSLVDDEDHEYTPEELNEIVELNSTRVTADQQREEDKQTVEDLKEYEKQYKKKDIKHEKALNQGYIDKVQEFLNIYREALNLSESDRNKKMSELNDKILEIDQQLEDEEDLDPQEKDELSRLRAQYKLKYVTYKAATYENMRQTEARLKESQKKLEECELLEEQHNMYTQAAERLKANKYVDTLRGGFTKNGIAMNTIKDENGVEGGEMIEILKNNKKRMRDTIDKLKEIRTTIDEETNGILTDEQLNILTMLRAELWDKSTRTDSMAADIISVFRQNADKVDEAVQNAESKTEELQQQYDAIKEQYDRLNEKGKQQKTSKTKKNLEDAKKKRKRSTKLQLTEKKLNKSKAELDKAKRTEKVLTATKQIVDSITEQKDANLYDKGDGSLIKGIIRQIGDFFTDSTTKRQLSGTEVATWLSNNNNAAIAANAVGVMDLDRHTMARILGNIIDMHLIANEMLEYNKKLKEFIGDPSKLNDALNDIKDRISREELDNKIKNLALSVEKAKNMEEIDNIIKNLSLNEAKAVFNQIAKDLENSTDEGLKEMFADYKAAYTRYNDFVAVVQMQDVSNNIMRSVMSSLANTWAHTLKYDQDTNHTEDSAVEYFDNLIDAVIKAYKKNGTPDAKKCAETLEKVRDDIKHAEESVRTKPADQVRKPAVNDKGKTDGDNTSDGQLTRKEILRRVENVISSYGKVTDKVQEFIDNYNREHPDDQITESEINDIRQKIADINAYHSDEEIDQTVEVKDSSDKPIDSVYSDTKNERSEQMQKKAKKSFNSDHPTKFVDNADYKIEFDVLHAENPGNESARQILKAVQKILDSYHAYDFVDMNLLAYAFGVDPKPTVHLLTYTGFDGFNYDGNEKLNAGQAESAVSGSSRITFMAVEIGNKEKANLKEAVEDAAMNHMKLITIGGKQYQIIGVLSMTTDPATEVQQAFGSLQNKLSEEYSKNQKEDSRKGDGFFIHKTTLAIDQVNTGMLETHGYENGEPVTVEKNAAEIVRESLEAKNKSIYCGYIVNGQFKAVSSLNEKNAVFPRQDYLTGNNGNLFAMFPRPDGKVYPIRLTRRTVSEWLNDGNYSLEDLYKSNNEYIKQIVNNINNLYKADLKFQDKMEARQYLSTVFVLPKGVSVRFDKDLKDNSKWVIKIKHEGKDTVILQDKGNEIDNAKQFLNAIGDAKFSLNSGCLQLEDNSYLTAGVFTIGINGFYNFNANVFVKPNDGTNNVNVSETGTAATHGGRIKGNQLTVDGGIKYQVENNTLKVTKYADGKETEVEGNERVAVLMLTGHLGNDSIEFIIENHDSKYNSLFGKSDEDFEKKWREYAAKKLTKEQKNMIFYKDSKNNLWMLNRTDNTSLKLKEASAAFKEIEKIFEAFTNDYINKKGRDAAIKLAESSKKTEEDSNKEGDSNTSIEEDDNTSDKEEDINTSGQSKTDTANAVHILPEAVHEIIRSKGIDNLSYDDLIEIKKIIKKHGSIQDPVLLAISSAFDCLRSKNVDFFKLIITADENGTLSKLANDTLSKLANDTTSNIEALFKQVKANRIPASLVEDLKGCNNQG